MTGKGPKAFGKYSLLGRVGEGGMADVHLATQIGQHGLLAIKRVKQSMASKTKMVEMFVQEGNLAIQLKHRSIVETYETGKVNGVHFICMEYIAGVDLSTFMRQVAGSAAMGAVPIHHAVQIAQEVCEGLHYAHELKDVKGRLLNVVNRDIDPSNIRLSFAGHVKLLDFGIARAVSGLRGEIGEVKGKFSYMSPEQARCMAVDRRSDIFSMGVVLHEMLSGKRLFRGQGVVNTLDRVRRADVQPPSRLNPDVPPELDAIVLKALQRDRGDRYQTAGEMAEALSAVPLSKHESAKDLGALLRRVCSADWREFDRMRKAVAEGRSLESETEQSVDAEYGELLMDSAVEISQGAEDEQARETPKWVYWAFIPALVLFGLAIYLVLR